MGKGILLRHPSKGGRGLKFIILRKVDLIEKVDLKNLMESTYNAIGNFQVRALYEGKDEILKFGRYHEEDLNLILDSLIDAETERNLILKKLVGLPPLTLDEIVENVDYNKKILIPAIEYLAQQGYLEKLIEIKTEIKKVKNKEGELIDKEIKIEIVRYQANSIDESFRENYFEPVVLVFDSGFCCNCGFCSSICPVGSIKVTADSLEIDTETCIKCGLCYSVCPRSFPTEHIFKALNKLNSDLKDGAASNYYINAYTASTKSDKIKKVCQDGGIVTTILYYLLKEKEIDAALTVTHSKDIWKPMPIFIQNIDEIYKTAGTKYANSPSLTILNESNNFKKIAVVGTPCMMLAIKKGGLYPFGASFFNNVKYTIGLFCMESFSYENIIKICTKIFKKKIDEVVKMDINAGKFIVKGKNGVESKVPLKEVTSFARDICHYCSDLTSEFADISVGSIGSSAGWSSVITRTKAGDELIKKLINDNLIDVKDLVEVKPGFGLVKKISRIKKSKYKKIEYKKNN